MNSGNYDSMIRASFKEVLGKLTDASSKVSADSTILNGKTKKEIYLYPMGDAASTGTWQDSIVDARELVITDGDYAGTYTLKAKEQIITNAAGSTYRYVSYWDNGTDQYYAKVGTYSRDAAGKITPTTAEFKYVDLAVVPVNMDWTNPTYQPTFTVDANGLATIDSASDKMIKLKFVNLASTPTTDKWYYNAADGYFYYVGKIAEGQETPQLLNSVYLDSAADTSYSKVTFDLIVDATGIQAAKEAVDSTDWVNGTNADLKLALENLF